MKFNLKLVKESIIEELCIKRFCEYQDVEIDEGFTAVSVASEHFNINSFKCSYLHLKDCFKLKSLPKNIITSYFCEITNCNKLINIDNIDSSRIRLDSLESLETVKHLKSHNIKFVKCNKLKSINIYSLTELEFIDCSSTINLNINNETYIPSNIILYDCPNLKLEIKDNSKIPSKIKIIFSDKEIFEKLEYI